MKIESEHAAYLDKVQRFLGAKWAGDRGITVTAAECLLDFVRRHKPRWLLELGTGFSTVVLRHAAAEVGCRVISADHDLQWLGFVRGILADRPEISHADYFTTNAVKRWVRRNEMRFDCVFVDHGPSGATRLDDMPWCRKVLAPQGVIILDDWYPPGTPVYESYTRKARRVLKRLRFTVTVVEQSMTAGDRKALCLAHRGSDVKLAQDPPSETRG